MSPPGSNKKALYQDYNANISLISFTQFKVRNNIDRSQQLIRNPFSSVLILDISL